MPLFGGHKKDSKKLHREHDEPQQFQDPNQTTGGTGAAGGMTGSSMGGSGAAMGDSNLPPTGGRSAYDQQQGHGSQPMGKDYGGMDAQPGMGGMNNNTGYNDNNNAMTAGNPTHGHMHPSSHGTNAHAQGGASEKGVGSMVGSNAVKAKVMQKEMEAKALKSQSNELAEAERLEQEALARRERAVAHGAHPDNRHLGGIPNLGTGTQGN